MWATMEDNERGLVRYGMFPAGKMQKAERDYAHGPKDFSKRLAVTLMECATRNGGMRA
jgi:hypothetical protein